MLGKDYLRYALDKCGAWEDYPFGPDVIVVKVAGKMFALFSRRNQVDNLSLKCRPDFAEILRKQYEGISAGYHLNKRHWNTLLLDGEIPDSEVCRLIDHSYDLVVASLTKEERRKLTIA